MRLEYRVLYESDYIVMRIYVEIAVLVCPAVYFRYPYGCHGAVHVLLQRSGGGPVRPVFGISAQHAERDLVFLLCQRIYRPSRAYEKTVPFGDGFLFVF